MTLRELARSKLLLIAIALFVSVALLSAYFFAVFAQEELPNLLMNARLRVYDGALPLSSERACGALPSCYNIRHYWSTSHVEKVRQHYADFSYPFAERGEYLAAVFKPGVNASAPVEAEEVDMLLRGECDIQQTYSCVEVKLVNIAGSLTDFDPAIEYADYTTFPADLADGTLIIYVWFSENY